MISYEVYKVIHLTGIALILLGLGVVIGGFAVSKALPPRLRMTAFMTHGLGMLIALIGGFGMAARLGLVHGLPAWIYAKLVIWLLLGVGVALARRKAQWSLPLVIIFALLVGAAASFAIWKPTFASEPTVSAPQ